MATTASINWVAIDADPRFQRLHARKTTFLTWLMIFSIVYYFLLPIGAAYFTDLFKMKVFGVVNFGLLFALSEFVVAWGIAGFGMMTPQQSRLAVLSPAQEQAYIDDLSRRTQAAITIGLTA